ncbi:hypothetical protein ACTXT7_013275 [Hymenolepis weldensis]
MLCVKALTKNLTEMAFITLASLNSSSPGDMGKKVKSVGEIILNLEIRIKLDEWMGVNGLITTWMPTNPMVCNVLSAICTCHAVIYFDESAEDQEAMLYFTLFSLDRMNKSTIHFQQSQEYFWSV